MRGDTSQSRRQVAVIGAGAAGLCAAKYLLGQGIDVVIHELGSHIGGLWVYENDNGLSPAYQSLHVNSEIAVTAYKDFPFPPSARCTPITARWRPTCRPMPIISICDPTSVSTRG